jgi:ABC-type Fe3+/spermidine/putrescine transport system ATPase subunit
MKLVSLESVAKRFDKKTAVVDFSLDIEEHERVVLLGPSGCGKTTVLRMLAGFIAPDDGRITIDGTLVAAGGRILKPPEERKLGVVFQDLALWPHLSVRGNIELGLKAHDVSAGDRARRVREMLALVEMADFVEARPSELSGGQQQRVALARALSLRPKLLLMDEPLSSLDLELNIRLRKEIIRLHKVLGFTLLYITHEPEEAVDLGTLIVIMRQGRIDQVGREAEVRDYFRRLAHQAEVGNQD